METGQLSIGDWVKMSGDGFEIYGRVTSADGNCSFKVVTVPSCDLSPRGKAKLQGLKGWQPEPCRIAETAVLDQIRIQILGKMNPQQEPRQIS